MQPITADLIVQYVSQNTGVTGRQIAAHFGTESKLINSKYNAETHGKRFLTTWRGIFTIQNIIQHEFKHYIKLPTQIAQDQISPVVQKEVQSDDHHSELEEIDFKDTATPTQSHENSRIVRMQSEIDQLKHHVAVSKSSIDTLDQERDRFIKSAAKHTQHAASQAKIILELQKEIESLNVTNDKLTIAIESSTNIETKDFESVLYYQSINLQAANSMAKRFEQENLDLVSENKSNIQQLKWQNKKYKLFIFVLLVMLLSIILIGHYSFFESLLISIL